MAHRRRACSGESGQATPEYVAVVLLVAALFAALLTLGGAALPGGDVARAVASKLVCAVKGTGECGELATRVAAQPTQSERIHGPEIAALIDARAPTISFEGREPLRGNPELPTRTDEPDFDSLPVDFRDCRERACADTILHGSIEHTQTGLSPTAFVHVIDCRDVEPAAEEGYDCSGERAGAVYLQYWFYYPESATDPFGRKGFHKDDWESYQVRIAPDGGALARASSHEGYNGRTGGLGSIGSDTGWYWPRAGWDTILDQIRVAAGSHAGTTRAEEDDSRHIDPSNLEIVPLDPIVSGGDLPDFEVTPPWEKDVWTDPESMGT